VGLSRPGLWALLLASAVPAAAVPQGHGPAYGLSTPTLGKGRWSVDLAAMRRVVGTAKSLMLRPMVSHGLTEDLQVSVSVPVLLDVAPGLPGARGMARMPTTPDVEVLGAWRFQRRATGVGARLESTLYLGVDYPTDAVRAGARTAPGFVGAAVTGYASRTVYAWIGGLYRRYLTVGDGMPDHLGDVWMYTAVVGYRPRPFQHDYPAPDWRVFVEAVGEYSTKTTIGGNVQPDRGGHQVFVGPTLLGLYGSWGISGGPVFPVHRRPNGSQPRETLRFIVNVTHWF